MSRPAQQPWTVGPGHRLSPRATPAHLAALVRTVLLPGPHARLQRTGLGAGLGASPLFEPLTGELAGTVSARARGSLSDALGDRLDVVEVNVTVADTTLSAEVVYRPKPAGETRRVALTLPAAAL